MEIEPFNHVKFTCPTIVTFLSKHKYNDALLKACEEVLIGFCKSSETFLLLQEADQKKESSYIFEYLRSFEKEIDSKFYHIKSSIDDAAIVIADKLNGSVMNGITALHHTMATTLNSLNMETLSQSITSTLKQGIDEKIKVNLLTFEAEVKDHMLSKVVDPVARSHERLMDLLLQLPKHVNDHIDVTDIETKLDNVQNGIILQRNLLNDVERQVDNQFRQLMSKYDLENLQEHLKQLPMLTKGLLSDVIKSVERDNHTAMMLLSTLQQQINKIGSDVETNINLSNTTKCQVESLDKQAMLSCVKEQSVVRKGMIGEDMIFDLLTSKLTLRDGYEVEKVCGQAMSCDIVIKRKNFSSIRVEVKATGKGTGEKVRSKEVEKFKRDLNQVNDHGIFVSLHSGIVGIGNFEIHQIPSTGKFAVYLSNNEYDIDTICEMVYLLYTLDKYVAESDDSGENGKINFTTETLGQIQTCLKDYNTKLQSIKMHMKESISLLNEIQLNVIERALFGGNTTKFQCDSCHKEFMTKSGLSKHKNSCKRYTI